MQYFTFVFHAIAFRPFIDVDLYIYHSSGKFQHAQDKSTKSSWKQFFLGFRLAGAQSVTALKRVLKGKSTFKKSVSGY